MKALRFLHCLVLVDFSHFCRSFEVAIWAPMIRSRSTLSLDNGEPATNRLCLNEEITDQTKGHRIQAPSQASALATQNEAATTQFIIPGEVGITDNAEVLDHFPVSLTRVGRNRKCAARLLAESTFNRVGTSGKAVCLLCSPNFHSSGKNQKTLLKLLMLFLSKDMDMQLII